MVKAVKAMKNYSSSDVDEGEVTNNESIEEQVINEEHSRIHYRCSRRTYFS